MYSEAVIFSEPAQILSVFGGVSALVYAATKTRAAHRVFRIIPPVVWLYVIPCLLTAIGVIPARSVLYVSMAKYLLPFALLLLTVCIDLRALAQIGAKAAILFVVGTLGVCLGVIISLVLLKWALPADGWQSMAALNASWIGGSANMLAIHQSLKADPSLLGPVVVVDAVVGYGWLAVLIALSAHQDKLDRFLRATDTKYKVISQKVGQVFNTQQADIPDLMLILGGAFLVTMVCRSLAEMLPEIGDPVIISTSTWTILMTVTLGLALSFTKMRKLEQVGAPKFGYVALFLLLASIGAQAEIKSFLGAPVFLLAGLIVMATHIGVLLLAAFLIRAPFVLVATGSMANIGGAVSAPIAAAAYAPSLASLGALLGVAGYIIGVYVPIFTATLLAYIAGL